MQKQKRQRPDELVFDGVTAFVERAIGLRFSHGDIIGITLTVFGLILSYLMYMGLLPGMYDPEDYFDSIINHGTDEQKIDACNNNVSDSDDMRIKNELNHEIQNPDKIEKICYLASLKNASPHLIYKRALALEASGKEKAAQRQFFMAAQQGDELSKVKIATYSLENNSKDCNQVKILINMQNISALALYKIGRFEYLGSYSSCSLYQSKIDGLNKIKIAAKHGNEFAIADELSR